MSAAGPLDPVIAAGPLDPVIAAGPLDPVIAAGPLDPLSGALLAMDTDAVPLVGGAVVVLGPPEGRRSLFSPSTRVGQLRSHFEAKAGQAKVLRRRVTLPPFGVHRPAWIDEPDLDVEGQVRCARLPSPADDTELTRLVERVMAQPIASDRPPWELVLVENLPDDRMAVVLKVHACLLSCAGPDDLLAALFDMTPHCPPVHSGTPHLCAPVVPRAMQLLGHAARGIVQQSLESLRAALQVVRLGISIASVEPWTTGASEPPSLLTAPRTSMNGPVGRRRAYATARLALRDAHLVSDAFGVDVDDVVLACVASALRARLHARREAVPDAVVAMVKRSSVAPGAGALRQMALPLGGPSLGSPAPVELLLALAGAKCFSEGRAAMIGRDLRDLISGLPVGATSRLVSWASRRRVFDRLPPPANVLVAMVTGPGHPLWCSGSRVEQIRPIAPVLDGVGVSVAVISYLDTLEVGLLACRRLLPDLEQVGVWIEGAMSELVQAASGGRRDAG